ncbi:MAG TPA: lipoprotein-releasing ABC transporter ATP-binding protein LolD [Xanthomonadales bacterium]|nr:lipoprotein-releasing ABC transporter ATP-binding protein LolD [Xanthomonadales bacterium]
MNNIAVLEARGVQKSFHQGSRELLVLKNVDLSLHRGQSVAIVGVSGAGKSTLLHILGGLDEPDAGEVLIEGDSLWGVSSTKRGELRNRALGFIYQFHHLLPEFTALENVAMPLLIRGISASESKRQSIEMLERVGLGERLDHKPGELSGGERQRAAVVRALVGHPRVVLCDEPTGNLDESTSDRVYGEMLELNQELGTSILLVTHDRRLANRMDKQYELQHGRLEQL